MKYLKSFSAWNIHNDLATERSFQFAIVVWLIITTVIGSWMLLQEKPPEQRKLYSDISTHVMIASSIWNDFDLIYTLDDLKRFQKDFPAESGPRGLFLKKTSNNELVFAKPYLYGASAAPFYGVFNVKGFIIFNSICLFVIGLVATRSLKGLFGSNWGLLLALAFVLPSPFVAWIAVPHPDLFIAALLALSVFLLLRDRPLARWHKVIGAILFAAALHDKPVFIVLLPFILLAMPRGIGLKQYIYIVLTMVLMWLVLALPNMLVDGTLLSYQGLRFYVGGLPYPLQNGWSPPQGTGITGHVFNPALIISSLLENISILPAKFFDFLLGRQTGILVYFPVALLLLIIGMCVRVGLGLWLFLGFFAYMVLYWLAFPTNGYGGGGSYGPRYMMQVLPIIPLAFINTPAGINKILVGPMKFACITVFVAAAVLQHKVLTFDQPVRLHALLFIERPLNIFPLENWLLPTTVASTLPDMIDRSVSSREILINKNHLQECKYLQIFCPQNRQRLVLFQTGDLRKTGELELWGSDKQEVIIKLGDEVLWKGLLNNEEPSLIQLGQLPFQEEAFDMLDKSFVRFAELDLIANNLGETERSPPPLLQFARDYKEFSDYGENLDASALEKSGILLLHGWSGLEPWGIWSDGFSPQMVLRGSDTAGTYEVVFHMQAYTPFTDPIRKAKLMANNRLLADLEFRPGDGVRDFRFRFETQPGEKFINFRFDIENPVSPAMVSEGSDPRMLGIGLVNFKLNKL